MIIDFKGNGGGGGGTTNYNQLENKPSINSVTLSGNVSSDQLGITLNELKAVENAPSAATNGSVFAEYRQEEIGHYGWEYDSATGSTFIFDMTLSPFVNIQVTWVTLCNFTYGEVSRGVTLNNEYTPDNRIIMPGVEEWQPGASGTVEPFTGVYLNFDYTDTEHPSFTFVDGNGDPVDVVISDEITPASSIQVTKELKQAYNQTESATTEWAFWGGQTSQGKAENTEFRMPTNFIMPSGETVVSNLTYYDIPINTYWDGTQFKVEYSLDSGTTWQWAFSATTFGGGDGPVTVGPSEGLGKTCELSYSWYYYGDIDKNCFKLSSNKSLSHPVVNNFTNDYNVTYFDTFLKSGSSYNLLTDKPSINGVELVGNKTTDDLGLIQDKLLRKDNLVLQKEINATKCLNWANINGIVVSIDWDGHSDMLLSFNWEDDWGNSGQTMYFSGGTWYNIPEDTGRFVLENGKLYIGYGGYGHLTSIAQGSLSSAVTFYKNVQENVDGIWLGKGDVISSNLQITNGDDWYTFVSGASRNVKLDDVSDGNLTINFGDNLEETVEISGGQIVAGPDWTLESDHYYKYTPDLGKLMIFNFGSLYWEIRGGSGKLFINNPDVNGLASSISAKEAYEPIVGPYMYNGRAWRKI